MFRHYDKHKDQLTNRVVVAFAIFFHDIVYDPLEKDNEIKSAEVFNQFTKDTTIDQAGIISELIISTASHCTEAHLSKDAAGSDDIHFLMDFDMAILGVDASEYKIYRDAIRQEYCHLDDSVYKQERSKILKLFLQIPNIFATTYFRQQFEEQARKNIRQEIDDLSK